MSEKQAQILANYLRNDNVLLIIYVTIIYCFKSAFPTSDSYIHVE